MDSAGPIAGPESPRLGGSDTAVSGWNTKSPTERVEEIDGPSAGVIPAPNPGFMPDQTRSVPPPIATTEGEPVGGSVTLMVCAGVVSAVSPGVAFVAVSISVLTGF